MNLQNKKILIIQLEGETELLQTVIACEQFTNDYPSFKIELVAKEQIANQYDFLLGKVFSKIHKLNVRDFFSNKNLNEARKSVSSYIQVFNLENIDLLVNFSKNKSSTFLTSLINAKVIMGFSRNEYAQLAINDKWSQYIYSNVLNGKLNNLNLVDIYQKMLGTKSDIGKSSQVIKNKLIAINPFCKSEKQKWSMAKWNEVIYKLLRDDEQIKIIILGENDDIAESQEIINNPIFSVVRNRIINGLELSKRESVFGYLSKVQLFIGHNTYLAHMAAIQRIPSIIISQGSSNFFNNAPYNKFSYILSPKNNCYPCFENTNCSLKPCHSGINHHVVTALTKVLLSNSEVNWTNLSKYITSFHVENASIYKTDFDDFGLSHTDLTNTEYFTVDYFRLLYRILWSYYLAEIDLKFKLPTCSNSTIKVLNQHIEGSNYLFELYGHAFNFANQILLETENENTNIDNIHNIVGKISEIDKLCDVTVKAFNHLHPIVNFFYTNHVNASGKNIVQVSGNNMISYHEATNVVAVMADLLEQTIKPRMGKLSKDISL